MKYLVLVFSIVLFGCAQSPPSTSNVDDWQLFGEQTAMKGYTKKMKRRYLSQQHPQLILNFMRLMTKVTKLVESVLLSKPKIIGS